MTLLEQTLVDYSLLYNLSLKFLQKSFFGPICSKIDQNSVSQGYSNVDCGAHNRPIFGYKASNEAFWTRLWFSQRFLYQNSPLLWNGGPSKIRLLQSCKVLWIHVIEAICTTYSKERKSYREVPRPQVGAKIPGSNPVQDPKSSYFLLKIPSLILSLCYQNHPHLDCWWFHLKHLKINSKNYKHVSISGILYLFVKNKRYGHCKRF